MENITTDQLFDYGHRCGDIPEFIRGHQEGMKRFVQPIALMFCKGNGIDFGCKDSPLEGAIGIDIEGQYANKSLVDFKEDSLDFIFSSHVLEHIPEDKIKELFFEFSTKIVKGGILFLFLPHKCVHYWNRELNEEARNWHLWVPTYEKIFAFAMESGYDIVDGNKHMCEVGSFWIALRRKNVQSAF